MREAQKRIRRGKNLCTKTFFHDHFFQRKGRVPKENTTFSLHVHGLCVEVEGWAAVAAAAEADEKEDGSFGYAAPSGALGTLAAAWRRRGVI